MDRSSNQSCIFKTPHVLFLPAHPQIPFSSHTFILNIASFACLCLCTGKSACVRTAGSIWRWCILGKSRWAKSRALWRTHPGGLEVEPRSGLNYNSQHKSMKCNLRNEVNAAPAVYPLLERAVEMFPLFQLLLYKHFLGAQSAHTSWLAILPQPVICLINNRAVCHPCRVAESYQPAQINYNKPVILLPSRTDTHISRRGIAVAQSGVRSAAPQIPWGGCYGDTCRFPSLEGFCVALNQ